MKKKEILGIIIWINIIWCPFYIWLLRPVLLTEVQQDMLYIDYLTAIMTSALLLGLIVEYFKSSRSLDLHAHARDAYRRFLRQSQTGLRRRQLRGEPPLGAIVYQESLKKEITPYCDPALHTELLERNFKFCIECGRVLCDD